MPRAPLIVMLLLPLLMCGCAGSGMTTEQWVDLGAQVARQAQGSSEGEAAAGVREALAIGADRAATELGRPGGFNRNPLLHIALPETLRPAADAFRRIGLGQFPAALEEDMNVGAEIAAARAAPIFRQAVARMTVQDALIIVRGDDTAATRYFRERTEGELQIAFRPAIQEGLRKTGYYDSYRAMLEQYKRIPLIEKPNMDLEQYVLDKAIDGLFLRLADEEKAIRHDPAKRTTELLKKVFGKTAAR